MKILGLGIDIISINRFKKMSKTFIKKLSKRILTKLEYKEYKKKKNKISFLSKKFAAKEAAAKALGIGIKKGIYFSDFEIFHNKDGKPKINFLNRALFFLTKKKAKKINISISDEKKYTIAIVIIE